MKTDPATAYALEVAAGDVLANRWQRLACQRHLRDLAEGPARGLVFDWGRAQRVVEFQAFCRHTKGEWAGRAFEPEPWQIFCTAQLFGWLHESTGLRRFSEGFVEVPRKNGKSTWCSTLGLYLTGADVGPDGRPEPGSEVYTAATKMDQARIIHRQAIEMAKQSPGLSQLFTTRNSSIAVDSTFSCFKPLGRDSGTLDGLNAHGLILDELHAWNAINGAQLYQVLVESASSRRQPLILLVTTAGEENATVWKNKRDYAEKVLDQVLSDDSFFCFMTGIDAGDDLFSETTWKKANPGYGKQVKVRSMKERAKRAKESPAELRSFRRYRLNDPVSLVGRWLDMAKWNQGDQALDLERLRGLRCYGGLDLSSISDLTALVLAFDLGEVEPGAVGVLPYFWCPKEGIERRSKEDRVPYAAWKDAGLLRATPGAVIDHRQIIDDIGRVCETFDLVDCGFDRWGATQVRVALEERGLTMVQMGQGFASMSAPVKWTEALVLSGRLWHGGHPILRWMASNAAVESDAAGNCKLAKHKSREKIDGMVALVMALDRMQRQSEGSSAYGPGNSVYETRGIVFA